MLRGIEAFPRKLGGFGTKGINMSAFVPNPLCGALETSAEPVSLPSKSWAAGNQREPNNLPSNNT